MVDAGKKVIYEMQLIDFEYIYANFGLTKYGAPSA